MPKNATINLRIDDELKADTEAIFRQLGLTTTEAIKIFLSLVRNKRGLPFAVQLDQRPHTGARRKSALAALRGRLRELPSSEEVAQRKQEEIDAEERRLRR